MLVVLLADVASNYIQYRTFQERLDLARRMSSIQEDAYQLASDSSGWGDATERDPQQAKQVLEQTRASIPQFGSGVAEDQRRAVRSVGNSAAGVGGETGRNGDDSGWATAMVNREFPADLLRRRPDVRRAERETAAQSAPIGIAKSDLYPRFLLNGSIGVQSEQFGIALPHASQLDRLRRAGVSMEHPELRPDRK